MIFLFFCLDILEKYIKRVEDLESDITRVLDEEYAERQLDKMQRMTNQAENLIKGDKNAKEKRREWFQTQQQRKEENGKYILKY